MNGAKISDELWIRIFRRLERLADVIACEKTCRQFRGLILTTPSLKYLKKCYAGSWMPYDGPKRELYTSVDLLDALKQFDDSWKTLDMETEFTFSLPGDVRKIALLEDYLVAAAFSVHGDLAFCVAHLPTQTLMSYPADALGLSKSADRFLVSSGNNLCVFVEENEMRHGKLKLHFREITNIAQKNDLAISESLVLQIERRSRLEAVELFGQYAVLLLSRRGVDHDYKWIVLDWQTGRIFRPIGLQLKSSLRGEGIAALDNDKFLFLGTERQVLDVVWIEPSTGIYHRSASFELPKSRGNLNRLHFVASRSSCTQSSTTHEKMPPVHSSNPDDNVIVIKKASVLIIVPRKAILSRLTSPRSYKFFEWEDWGSKNTYLIDLDATRNVTDGEPEPIDVVHVVGHRIYQISSTGSYTLWDFGHDAHRTKSPNTVDGDGGSWLRAVTRQRAKISLYDSKKPLFTGSSHFRCQEYQGYSASLLKNTHGSRLNFTLDYARLVVEQSRQYQDTNIRVMIPKAWAKVHESPPESDNI